MNKNYSKFELADGWYLQRILINDVFEWIICDPNGDRLGNTPKHKAEFDCAMIKEIYKNE